MSLLDGADVRRLLADAAERAGCYVTRLDDRPVAPGSAALAGLARFDEPLPDSAGDASATLALLDEAGSPATWRARAAAARDQQLASAGWDVQARGLFGAPELTVVIGDHADRPRGSTGQPCGSASPAGPRPGTTSRRARRPSSPRTGRHRWDKT